jgi:hypothetical protein
VCHSSTCLSILRPFSRTENFPSRIDTSRARKEEEKKKLKEPSSALHTTSDTFSDSFQVFFFLSSKKKFHFSCSLSVGSRAECFPGAAVDERMRTERAKTCDARCEDGEDSEWKFLLRLSLCSFLGTRDDEELGVAGREAAGLLSVTISRDHELM